jgi:hypothetical protein
VFGDPTYGDAILDRVIHNAYRLELKGKTMRPGIAQTAGAEAHGATQAGGDPAAPDG